MKSINKGFSLIELLVVIAIIAVLATFVGPAARDVMMGNSTTQAAELIVGQMASARMQAITKNNTVELRLYKMADPSRPGEQISQEDSWRVRGMQAFEMKPDGTGVALSRIKRLPETAILDSNTQWSSLLDDGRGQSGTEKLPVVGTSYKYFTIRFRPDGGTELPPDKAWYMTIHDAQWGDKVTSLPPNFITVQLDPVQGSTTVFRPGLK